MILEIDHWHLGYQQILKDCRPTGSHSDTGNDHDHDDDNANSEYGRRTTTASSAAAAAVLSSRTVLLLCNADVDAMACARILTYMLRSDGVHYQLLPCLCYKQFEYQLQTIMMMKKKNSTTTTTSSSSSSYSTTNDTMISSIVLLNFGASKNLTKLFEKDGVLYSPPSSTSAHSSSIKVYVMDCRRPIHLANVYAGDNIVIFTDPSLKNTTTSAGGGDDDGTFMLPSDGDNLSGQDDSSSSESDDDDDDDDDKSDDDNDDDDDDDDSKENEFSVHDENDPMDADWSTNEGTKKDKKGKKKGDKGVGNVTDNDNNQNIDRASSDYDGEDEQDIDDNEDNNVVDNLTERKEVNGIDQINDGDHRHVPSTKRQKVGNDDNKKKSNNNNRSPGGDSDDGTTANWGEDTGSTGADEDESMVDNHNKNKKRRNDKGNDKNDNDSDLDNNTHNEDNNVDDNNNDDDDNININNGDDDDDNNNISPREKHRQRRDRLRTYYNSGSFYGLPSAYVAYVLSTQLRYGNDNDSTGITAQQHLLWLACVGVTDAYLHSRFDILGYATVADELRYKCIKLFPDDTYERALNTVYAEDLVGNHSNNNNTENTSNSNSNFGRSSQLSGKPKTKITLSENGRIIAQKDYKFFLLRHSTLLDSMLHSEYVSTKLQVWNKRGEHKLMELLAKMGYPLDECRQPYAFMKPSLRRRLLENFNAHAQVRYCDFCAV
jgi:hypothetical protein